MIEDYVKYADLFKSFGVMPLLIEDGNYNGAFKTTKEQRAYEVDSFDLEMCVKNKKDIPLELATRLLNHKKKLEKVGYVFN